MRSLFKTAIAALSWFAASPASTAPITPPEARALIFQVHRAAKAKDFLALEKLMVKRFVWSFGGDEDVHQALAAWKEDPHALHELHRVTQMPCTIRQGGIVECPKNAGINYRAGFKKTELGWRMVYFVAGD